MANKDRSDRITTQFRRIRRTILPARRIKQRRRKFAGTSLFQHKIFWRGGDFIGVRSTGTPVLIWNFPYGPIRLGSVFRSPGDSTWKHLPLSSSYQAPTLRFTFRAAARCAKRQCAANGSLNTDWPPRRIRPCQMDLVNGSTSEH